MVDMKSEVMSAARASGRRAIDEVSCKKLVAACGVRVPKGVVVRRSDDLAPALATLQAPWVLKIISPDVIHKTEVGGVRTQLMDAGAVAAAMDSMTERARAGGFAVEGFLVEETAPPGIEVVIGGVRDPSFGWLLMFGLGGILVEYLRDVAFRICPIARIDAVEMIGELQAAPLLEGARGRPAVHRDALVDALLAIGGERGLLAQAGNDIAEIDLNPLIASEHGAMAVDVRMILAHG